MKNTVLVTGASRGIGREIATRFARAGYGVVIQGNGHMDEAERLCASLIAEGCDALPVCADITDGASVARMAEEIHARFGGVRFLVNNAGVALPQQLLTDCAESDWQRVFDVNMKGAYLVTRAVLADMVDAKDGAIVNISSMWGVTGGSCEVPYSASKAALIGFTKALAKELAPSNIRVNCIAPGFIETDMNANLSAADVAAIIAETPLERAGTPGDIAGVALFLCDQASSFMTGQVLSVDGGRCI